MALHYTNIVCASTQFDVTNGSLIKFVVGQTSDTFIDNVLNDWKPPLNRMDGSDERTILDYIRDQQRIYAKRPLERRFKRYYDAFRAAGARHREELRTNESNDAADPYEAEVAPLLPAWDKACYYSEDLAAVKKDGQWGYVSRSRHIHIRPQFDGAFGFREGRAAVTKNEKWGFIDRDGRPITAFIFEHAQPFSNGLAAVKIAGHRGFIDQEGNIRVEPIYDRAYRFRTGIALVQQAGKWGSIDKTGRIDTPIKCPHVRGAFTPYRPGVSGGEVSEDGQSWHRVNSDGTGEASHRN